MLPVVGRWCRRYAARFTAVDAAFRNTISANAARFLAVALGVCCSSYCCWGRLLHTARVNTVRFSAVGVGVMLWFSLLSVPPFTLRPE